MTRAKKTLGPRSPGEEVIYAEQKARVDLQHALHGLMKSQNITNAELARRLGVSRPRISQLFASGCRLNVRSIARIAHVLGHDVSIAFVPKGAR